MSFLGFRVLWGGIVLEALRSRGAVRGDGAANFRT